MSTWTAGIETITLFVEDLAAAKKFYENVFSFPVVYEDESCTVFNFGTVQVNILKVSEADELIAPARVAKTLSGSRVIYTLPVQDVDAVCAELASRGVVLLNGPMDRPWGIRTASFADPAGHIWEIAR